jgi:hypothetical protein
MLIFSRSGRTLALAGLLAAAGCGGGDEDPNAGDALANATIVRCDMPEDHVCREYQRGQQGNATAFVDLPSARSTCAAGWPGGVVAPGKFSADPCAVEDALGRCYTQTHTLPRLTTIDYFYKSFGNTDTLEDPTVPLKTLCASVQSNAKAASVDVTSTFQIPPF